MRVSGFLHPGCLTFLWLVLTFAGTGCKPSSHEKAKNVKRAESQLSLPAATPEQQKADDKHLEWNMETTVDAYDQIGSKDSKWNTPVRNALTIFAQMRSYGTDVEGYPGLVRGYASRAIELGCNDPLLRYLDVRLEDMTTLTSLEVAERFATASDALENSQYPPIRKFYAAARAHNAFRKIKPFPTERAWIYKQRTTGHGSTLLNDRKMPVKEADDVCSELLVVNVWGDKKERFDEMKALLDNNWSKHGFAYVVQGNFYIDYAWDGRSRKAAKEVTDEQWKLFRERLALAESVLLKGIEVDPKEGRLPAAMIKVVSGQSKGFPEMKSWFEKAMQADPNNYWACENLLHFLQPRWFGSRQAMIAFGRECANSDTWGGTVPLILADAHRTYNRTYGATDGSYWKQPDVWPDIKLSYEKFFQINPRANSWRHNYARYAYWCGQWDTVQEQVTLLGNNINHDFFGGFERFEEMMEQCRIELAKR